MEFEGVEEDVEKNAEGDGWKYFDIDGDEVEGLYMDTVDGVKIYSMTDSSVADTVSYVLEDPDGYVETLHIDVSGQPVSSEDIENEYEVISYIADFIADDINSQLELDEAKSYKTTKVGVKQKETVKESTLSSREKYLTRLVENALGLENTNYDPDNEEWEPEDDYPGQTRYVTRRDIEEGEEMVAEKPLPKYENIEKLMQEIEHGTNEAAYKHKMNKMKEVAEMLETRVAALEEGEGAEFIDTKKVKQMKKDIMTLRKQAEKLEKEYDKKFGEALS